MGLNAKAIKSKIGSVKSTKKITRAMEMIAAAKMRKAVKLAANARHYANLAAEIVEQIGEAEVSHPLLKPRKTIKNELLILISSNRGLCGNYNAALNLRARKYLAEARAGVGTRLNSTADENADNHTANDEDKVAASNNSTRIQAITTGKKAGIFAKHEGLHIIEAYERLPEEIELADILPILNTAVAGYEAKDFDRVSIAYTRFKSSLVQTPQIAQLLPLTPEILFNFADSSANISPDSSSNSSSEPSANSSSNSDSESSLDSDSRINENNLMGQFIETTFEPDLTAVLDYAIRRVLESQVYQAFLESRASEHSSRMVAMKNATDAASDMIDSLTMEYNKSRQAAITQEIAEISSAAAAIK